MLCNLDKVTELMSQTYGRYSLPISVGSLMRYTHHSELSVPLGLRYTHPAGRALTHTPHRSTGSRHHLHFGCMGFSDLAVTRSQSKTAQGFYITAGRKVKQCEASTQLKHQCTHSANFPEQAINNLPADVANSS